MFTRDIRSLVVIGKMSVMWKSEAPAAAASVAPPVDPLTRAQELLKKIRESTFFKGDELKELQELLKKAGKINEDKAKDLKDLLEAEIKKPTRTQEEWNNRDFRNPTIGDKKDIQDLLTAWQNDFKVAAKKLDAGKVGVVHAIKPQVATVKQEVADVLDMQKVALTKVRAKYESDLNFNDIMIIMKDPQLKAQLDAISPNAAYYETQVDQTRAMDTPLTKFLDSTSYIAKSRYGNNQNNYSEVELIAIIRLRDQINKDPALRKSLFSVDYAKTELVAAYDPQKMDVSVIIQHLADLSGDGMLSSTNGKEYSSNMLVSLFQRIMNGGSDANLHLEGELPLLGALRERVKSMSDLNKLIQSRVNITDEKIAELLKSKDGLAQLVKMFHRGHLIDTARTTRNISRDFDRSKESRYQIEKAEETALEVKKIAERLKSEGMVARLVDKFQGAGINPDATTIEGIVGNTALQIFKWNPRFLYSVGAHATVTDTTTRTTTITQNMIQDIEIIQDADGRELSRTSSIRNGETTTDTTESRERKTQLKPTLFIGFNQDLLRYRSETAGAGIQAGAGLLAAPGGVRFPITLSGSADYTLDNKNLKLQTQAMTGNTVIGGRISLSYDTKSGKTIPSFGVDLNPNDVRNAIEKQEIRLARLFEKIKLDEKGNADFADIRKEVTAFRDAHPKDKNAQLEAELMLRFFTDMEVVLKSDAMKDKSPEVKRTLIARNILSYQSAYIAAVRDGLKGVHVAGLNVSFIPLIHGVFVGLNVQQVQQKVEKVAGRDLVEERILSSKEISFNELKGKVSLDSDKNSLIIASFDGLQIARDIRVEDVGGQTKISPAAGKKFSIRKVSYSTLEGATMSAIYISQIDAPAQAPRGVVARPGAPEYTPTGPAQGENGPKVAEAYSRESLVRMLKDAKSTEQQLFVMSRGVPALASAMNLVIADNYSEALIALGKDKRLKPYVDQISLLGPDDRKKMLEYMLFATSGSRLTRTLDRADITRYNAEYKKNQGAFAKRLVESAPIGSDKDALMKAHAELALSIKLETNDGSTNFVKASDRLAGSKDISGLVTFSQVDSAGKLTVSGLKGFHGDITIAPATANIDDPSMKAMLIADAEKKGILALNMNSSNAHIEAILNGTGITAPKFTPETYKAFILSGKLPEGWPKDPNGAELITVTQTAKFKMGRAALPGAVCFNDVMLLGYPKIAVAKPGQKVPPKEEIPEPLDQSPVLESLRTGDITQNAGSENADTFGLNFSRIIENVTNEVVNNITTTTVNQRIIVQPRSSTGGDEHDDDYHPGPGTPPPPPPSGDN